MEPGVSKPLNNIALTYLRGHDFEEALNLYEVLLKWDRKTDNQFGVAITLNNMGLIYDHHLGSHEEAQRQYSQALKIFKKLGNEKYIKSVKRNMEIIQGGGSAPIGLPWRTLHIYKHIPC